MHRDGTRHGAPDDTRQRVGIALESCEARARLGDHVAVAQLRQCLDQRRAQNADIRCLVFGDAPSDALQLRLQVGTNLLPYQLFQMIPYVMTLIALTIFGSKIAGPKSKGKPYYREER